MNQNLRRKRETRSQKKNVAADARLTDRIKMNNGDSFRTTPFLLLNKLKLQK